MKARPIQGIENEFEMIELEAENHGETSLLERMWEQGVRVVSSGRRDLVICSPNLANLTAFYLTDKERKIIHDALVQPYVKDRIVSSLITRLSTLRE